MGVGGRITDEVEGFRRIGDLRSAVRVVRARKPERLRWRSAVATMTKEAGGQQGMSRLRIEEPIREIVLDMEDRILRRETVLDARKVGVDLDRGEVLPQHTRWDLKRTAFLVGVDHEVLGRYTQLPAEFECQIDTGAVVLLSRSLAHSFLNRADKLLARLPADKSKLPKHERFILERAEFEREQARRWAALSKTLAQGSR